jgi:Reverse transcriptase (RNA-dependent DNA polymerase)
MKAPEGFNYSSSFWRLRKGLYGLRQAGRQWYLTLHQAYTDLGYVRCETNWSVYMRRSPSSTSMSATSVDDILLASDSKAESDRTTSEINDKFTITDSGDADWILSCRIT